MDEAAILEQRLRAGEVQALADLVELHRERLLRTIHLRLGALARRVEADDVLQEAFVAAAARLEHLVTSSYSSGFLWLRAIVLQTLIDLHRHHCGAAMRDARKDLAAPVVSSDSLGELFVASATSPSGVMTRHETAAIIAAVMAELPASDREIIALRHAEDLGNNEIAEVLGIQPKAASIRYVRAVMRLKELLLARHIDFADGL
jgi:RNA polymerase sigma-70 factor (ECF subfamily)